MSKKLKPDVNQLPLTKYVKTNNNTNIVTHEVQSPLFPSPTVSEPNPSLDNSPNTAKKRKNPCESASPQDKISPPNKKISVAIMSEEEYNKMEQKLHTNLSASLTTSLTEMLTENLKGSMQGMIDNSLATAIATMNNASKKMLDSSTAMTNQSVVIRELKEENRILNRKLYQLETAHNKLATKVNAIESNALENNLIIKGVFDEKWEKETVILNKIYPEIASTIEADSNEERMNSVRRIGIRRCKRLGHYEEGKCRPISVEFSLKQDVEFLVENKSKLRTGVYLEHEYSAEVEYQRKVLRPILTAAQKIPSMKKKCKLDGATLKIKGKHYTLKTLHKLPPELNAFKLSSKTDEEKRIVGFFGQLNPLSNFHDAPFIIDGIQFHTSEQYIQYQKAQFAKDIESCNKILCTSTARECKNLSSKITNLDVDAWESVAKERCSWCKFEQNPRLMECLLDTKDMTIVECAKNELWGTGKVLANEDCLDSTQWHSQGILGEILCEIRNEEQSRRNNEQTQMTT